MAVQRRAEYIDAPDPDLALDLAQERALHDLAQRYRPTAPQLDPPTRSALRARLEAPTPTNGGSAS